MSNVKILHSVEIDLRIKDITATVWSHYCGAKDLGLLTLGNTASAWSIPKCRTVFSASNIAGCAYRHVNRIEINAAFFLEDTIVTYSNLEETIAHEIAHVIQFKHWPSAKQAHGPEFRSIMASIGYTGNTYHRMNVSVAKQAARKVRKGDEPLMDL